MKYYIHLLYCANLCGISYLHKLYYQGLISSMQMESNFLFDRFIVLRPVGRVSLSCYEEFELETT
jgi:hypothetical protein